MNSIKQELYRRCHEYLMACVTTAQQAIDSAQAAANEETKSSVGDKYETTRAMLQLEMEKHAEQLASFEKLRQVLNRIDPGVTSPVIQPGSLVITDLGNFYISISAGKIIVDDTLYFAISAASPLGSKLMGLSTGATVPMDKRVYKIKEVK